MKKSRRFSLSNLFVTIAFLIVYVFLIGVLIIENGIFEVDIINTGYEILDYDVVTSIDPSSPTDVKKKYYLTVGGMKYDSVYIAFYTKHQYCNVYVDNELVSGIYPNNDYLFTKTVGCNWIMFEVTKEKSDKEIKVEIVPAYDNVYDFEIEFIKGTAYSIFYKVLLDNLPQVILGFVAIIVGAIFIVISLWRKIKNKECFTIFMWGLFSLFLGVWRLFDSSFISFVISKKPLFIYYVVVTMLTLCPIPFLYALRAETNKFWNVVFDFICIITALVASGQIILQVFYQIDVRKYLYIYHYFLLGCVFIVLLSEVYHKIRKFKRTSIIHEYFPMICIFSVVIDLLIYYYTQDTKFALCTIFFFLFYIIIAGILTLRGYEIKEKKLKDELEKSQITLSLSQIQPHFIYNTLSSIRYLCKSDAELAQQSIDDFSSYLRANVDSLQNKDLIPFEKELSFVEVYVKLEKLRFGDKINMVYDIQEKNFDIPSLSIQPLVENAIKHGLSVKEEQGTIILRTERIDKKVKISIIDDGVGFIVDSERKDGRTHVGLMNVKTRLHYLLNAEMDVYSDNNGTKIEIIINNTK